LTPASLVAALDIQPDKQQLMLSSAAVSNVLRSMPYQPSADHQRKLLAPPPPPPPLLCELAALFAPTQQTAPAASRHAGMPLNQVLLRHSLCDNPDLMTRVSLFATGLGEANKDCTVVSSVSNAGNGNVICSADVQAAMMDLSAKEIGHHYVVREDGQGEYG
jgi:hypothetical protein